MRFDTRALPKFRQWCDRYTYEVAASILSVGIIQVTPSALSNWYHGYRRPTLLLMRRLEIVSGIPMSDWLTENERELLEEAKRTEVPAV